MMKVRRGKQVWLSREVLEEVTQLKIQYGLYRTNEALRRMANYSKRMREREQKK